MKKPVKPTRGKSPNTPKCDPPTKINVNFSSGDPEFDNMMRQALKKGKPESK